MTLEELGWNPSHAAAFHVFSLRGLLPARVILQQRHLYRVLSEHGPLEARCTGRLLHQSTTPDALPAVGDWVAFLPRGMHAVSQDRGLPMADLHAVLPRASCLARRAAGNRPEGQVLAANVDTVFVVTGLDQDFSPRRLERYLAVARSGSVEPVFLLNKADLHPNPAAALTQAEAVVQGAPVLLLSARHNEGLEALEAWLQPGRTVALLGSSGVGKSTLLNQLLGTEQQAVGPTSLAVGKGCHTTTSRELIPLASGALVIDTPGLRELQFWDLDQAAIESSFSDIETLAARCRYRDCSHVSEPGCAVRLALEEGSLEEARWDSYRKLQKEQSHAARKVDPLLARQERDRWKRIHMGMRQRERFERDFE